MMDRQEGGKGKGVIAHARMRGRRDGARSASNGEW